MLAQKKPPLRAVPKQLVLANGRYRSLFQFAQGGMAEVYVGRQTSDQVFDRAVAIKRILPHLAEEPRFVEMFLDEARIAAAVSSPHVVQMIDFGRDDEGAPYIVMELVLGLSLAEVMESCVGPKRAESAISQGWNRVPGHLAAEIVAQAAIGLDDAHHATDASGRSLAIVHRDVSPQNILVGVDGRVRVGDFGIARARARLARTENGEAKGKLAYFSQEQALGHPLDQRSDVFALGVVAWELFAGQRLFLREHPVGSLQAVLTEPIPALTSINASVPKSLSDAVSRALERDVERRTASGAEFARQLRRAYPMGESGMPVRLDARQSSGVRGREPTAAALKLGALVTELGGVRLADFRDRIQLVFRSQRACDGTEPVNVHDQITEPTPSGSRRRMTNESPTNASKTAVRNDPKVSVESPKTAHRPPAKLPRPKLTLAASAPQSQRVPSRPPPPPPSRAPQAQRMRLVSTDSVHEAVLSHSHVPHTPADDSFLEEKIFRSWKWSRVVTVLSVSVVLVAMGAAASWYRPRAAHASTAVAKHALVSSQPTPVARRPSSEPTTFANTASSPRTPLDIDSVEDLGAHEHHSRRHHVHRHRSNGGHEHRHRRHQQPASDPSVMRRVRPASQLY